ncbi:MAG: carbonic anhydrase [Deltaproteobacteria bacterium]|nr:carbonic anhydrase [Deltaproteobacteria bacterium]
MKDNIKLLNNNEEWAKRVEDESPGFFRKLEKQQKPKYLWIGCSDSRVPANQITGLLPGEVFVHRNISNQVINTDINLMCVLQYAIEILRVKHIIVCGHYGCGGIDAVMRKKTYGLLDHWLENVKASMPKHERVTLNEMCELNVIRQVDNLSQNTIVQRAWQQKRKLYVHGWIYSISNGLIKDLKITQPRPHNETLKRDAAKGRRVTG